MSVNFVSNSNNVVADDSNFFVKGWKNHPVMMTSGCALLGVGIGLAFQNRDKLQAGFESSVNFIKAIDGQKLHQYLNIGRESVESAYAAAKPVVMEYANETVRVGKIHADYFKGLGSSLYKAASGAISTVGERVSFAVSNRKDIVDRISKSVVDAYKAAPETYQACLKDLPKMPSYTLPRVRCE